MVQVKRCFVDMKEEDGKLIKIEKGYCDDRNPNKKIHKETIVNKRGIDEVFEKLDGGG